MFFKIGVLKSFANSTGKHLRWSLFLLRLTTLLTGDSSTGVFPINFKITYFEEHLQTTTSERNDKDVYIAYKTFYRLSRLYNL